MKMKVALSNQPAENPGEFHPLATLSGVGFLPVKARACGKPKAHMYWLNDAAESQCSRESHPFHFDPDWRRLAGLGQRSGATSSSGSRRQGEESKNSRIIKDLTRVRPVCFEEAKGSGQGQRAHWDGEVK
jgi:hypothetical protein